MSERPRHIEKIHCGVCTKKCGWRNHVNNPYRFEVYEEEEERTSDELRQRYEQATSKKTTKEQIIDGIKKELKALEDEVKDLIKQAKMHLERLHSIALRPINMSEMDYIDLLIEQEKNEGKPGFLERVKALEGFRKQAEPCQMFNCKEILQCLNSYEKYNLPDFCVHLPLFCAFPGLVASSLLT